MGNWRGEGDHWSTAIARLHKIHEYLDLGTPDEIGQDNLILRACIKIETPGQEVGPPATMRIKKARNEQRTPDLPGVTLMLDAQTLQWHTTW